MCNRHKRTEHLPNKAKTRYNTKKHFKYHKPRCLDPSTKIQTSTAKTVYLLIKPVTLLQYSYIVTILHGPKKYNIVEVCDKAFKTDIMNIFKDLKEEMNKFLNGVCENPN